MRNFIFILAAASLLCGCVATMPTPQQISQMDCGPAPTKYQATVKMWNEAGNIYAGSTEYGFLGEPAKGVVRSADYDGGELYSGWMVIVNMTNKDSLSMFGDHPAQYFFQRERIVAWLEPYSSQWFISKNAVPAGKPYTAPQIEDEFSKRQYIADHPELETLAKMELRDGTITISEAASMSAARAAYLKKQQDGRQKYIDEHPDLSSDIRFAILAGKVIVGMNSQEVLAAWQSDRWTVVHSTDFGDTSISDWKLGDTYVTFKGGTVFSVSYIPQ
jgi:hypothetical protein